ncbi:alpha/beta hydrolase [Cribrihabitans neustonicus]|uniref:alpha/beta hydrolase n=1 Tax=Cribrihabitans neustonicus TaxID=1429085 RepID=UPI003B5C7564
MWRLRAALSLGLVLLAGCTALPAAPTVPDALEVGTPRTVFAATTRAERPDRTFGPGRSRRLSHLELTVSIPPLRRPGSLIPADGTPDPRTQFAIAERRRFPDAESFTRRLRAEARRTGGGHDATVFVHGFNATLPKTAFRAAQLAQDIGLPGATVIYSWPSQGSPLGYAYDADSVLFARDGLEQLLLQIRAAGFRRTVLVAHSLGAQLTMEALRQIEIKSPGWAAENLGGVILMSPDLDIDVFKSQIAQFRTVPQPFLIFVSRSDKVLTLSQGLRGRRSGERLGNLGSLDRIAHLPVEVIDTTAYADSAESGHFVAATSPALIALLSAARATAQAFGREAGAAQLLPARAERRGRAVQLSLSGSQ